MERCSVTMATQEGQSAACASLIGRLTKEKTEGQTAGEKGKTEVNLFLFVCCCVCVYIYVCSKLTICSLHDSGVVVVATGNASYRNNLGLLRMKRGAL